MAIARAAQRFPPAAQLMFAAHFAAGVAIKSQVPETPIRPLLAAVFFPDFVWILLAGLGIEPAAPGHYFDGWSHSLVMVLLYAVAFAWVFRRSGRAVALAMFVAVFSHFLLDLPIHPVPLELYPHSAVRFAVNLATVDSMRYWWIQLAITLVLLAVYAAGMRRLREPSSSLIYTCLAIVAMHVVLLPG